MKYSNIFLAIIPFYGASVRFRFYLRLREFFRKYNMKFLATCLKTLFLYKYGCELSINAEISPKAKFMHTVGVVIGEGCKVESGVVIYSNVVLGRKNIHSMDDYPIIKKNVVLSTGVTVLGKIEIDENVIIGAKSLVINSIVGSGTYFGIPAVKVK